MFLLFLSKFLQIDLQPSLYNMPQKYNNFLFYKIFPCFFLEKLRNVDFLKKVAGFCRQSINSKSYFSNSFPLMITETW